MKDREKCREKERVIRIETDRGKGGRWDRSKTLKQRWRGRGEEGVKAEID